MEANYKKLIELIEQHHTTMLTTRQNDGLLKSRPMTISEVDENGEIWFFGNENSCKANEIESNPQVNLSFTDRKEQSYASVSGIATIVTNEDRMKELMSPMVKAWFPKGLEDPSLSLIKVSMEKAAYWVTDENKVLQLVEIGKALLSDERAKLGEHESIDLDE